jgi:hypothetical protein
MDVVDQRSANVEWPESDGLSAVAATAAGSVVPAVVTPEKNDNDNDSNSNSNSNSKKKLPSSYSYYSGRGIGRRGLQPPASKRQLQSQDKENNSNSVQQRLNSGGSVGRLRQLQHNIRSSEIESSESESPAPALPLPVLPTAAAVVVTVEEELASVGSCGLELVLSESERVDDEDDEDLVGEEIGGNNFDDHDGDDDTNQKIMNPAAPSGTTTTTPLTDDTTLFGFNDCLVSYPTPVIQEDDDEDYSDNDEDYSVNEVKKEEEEEATATTVPLDNNKHSGEENNKNGSVEQQQQEVEEEDNDDKTLSSYMSTFERILSEDDGDNSNNNNNNTINTADKDNANGGPSSRPQYTRVIAAVPESSSAAAPDANTTTTTPITAPPRIRGGRVPISPPSHNTSADSLVLPSIKRVTPRVYHRPHSNQTVVVGGGGDVDVDVDVDDEEEDCDSKMSEDSTKARRRAARMAAHNRSRKSSSSSSRPPKSSNRSGSSSSSSRMRNKYNTKSSSNDSTKSNNSNAMGHAVSLAFDKMLGFTAAGVGGYSNNMDHEYSSDEESESMMLDIRDALSTAFGCSSAPLPFSPTSSHRGHRGSNSSVVSGSGDRGSSARVRRRRNRINDLLTDDDSRTTVDSTVVSSSKKSTTRHVRSGSNASAASILSGISDGVGSIFSFDTTDELADFSKETSTSRKATATTAASSSLPPLSSNNRSKPKFKVPDVFDSKIIYHSSSWNSISSSVNNQKQPNGVLYSKDLSHDFAPVDLLQEGDNMFEEGKGLLKVANTKVDALMENANTKVDKFVEVANTKVDELVVSIQGVLGNRFNQADLSFSSTPSTLNTFGESTVKLNDFKEILHTSSEATKDSLNMSVGDASDTMNRLVGTLSESLEVISETEAIHTTETAANTTAEEIAAMKTTANLIVGKQSSSPGKKMDDNFFGEKFTNTTIDTAKAGVKSFADNFKADIFDGVFDTAKSFDGMFDTAAKAVVSEPEPLLSSSTTFPKASLEVFEKSSEDGFGVDVFDDLLVTKVDVTNATAPRKPPKVRSSSFTRDAGAPDSAVKSLIGMFDSTVKERGSTPDSSPESNRREVFEEKKEEECNEEKKETAEDQDRRCAAAAAHLITMHQETTNASTIAPPSKKEKEYLVWESPTAKDETDVPESHTFLDAPQPSSETKKTPKFGGVRGLIRSFTKNKKGSKSTVSKSQSSVKARTPSASKSSEDHARSKKLKPEVVKDELSSNDRTNKSSSLPVAHHTPSVSSKSQSSVKERTPSVSNNSGDHAPSKKLEPEGIPSTKLEPEGIPSKELEPVEVKEEPVAMLTPYADADPDLDHVVSDMEIDREDDGNITASPSKSMLIVESSSTDQDGNNKAEVPAAPKGFEEIFDTPVDFEKVVTRTQSNEASETDMIFDFSNCSDTDEVDLNVDGWVKFDDSKNDRMSQCPSTPVRIPSVVPDTPKTSNIGSDRTQKTTSLTSREEHPECTEKSPFGTPFCKNGKFNGSIIRTQFDDDIYDDAEAVTANNDFNTNNNINIDRRDNRQPSSPDNNNDNNNNFIDFDQSGDWESFVGGFESKGFGTSISPQKVSAFPTF